MEIPQHIVNFILSAFSAVLGAVLGFLAKSLHSLREADAELTQKVHDLAIIVAGMQQAQADTLAFRAEMREQLKYIIARLDKDT